MFARTATRASDDTPLKVRAEREFMRLKGNRDILEPLNFGTMRVLAPKCMKCGADSSLCSIREASHWSRPVFVLCRDCDSHYESSWMWLHVRDCSLPLDMVKLTSNNYVFVPHVDVSRNSDDCRMITGVAWSTACSRFVFVLGHPTEHTPIEFCTIEDIELHNRGTVAHIESCITKSELYPSCLVQMFVNEFQRLK